MKTAKQLWAIKEPWTARQADSAGTVTRILGIKTASDSIRSMAVGWRPPKLDRFESLEREATILGGIQALAAAGIGNWGTVDLQEVPAMKLIGTSSEPGATLRKIVKRIGQAEGAARKFDSVKDAAEYVRAKVIENKLEKVAWAARGAWLTGLSLNNQNKRGTVEGVTSTAMLATGKAITASAGVAASTVVGLPVAAVLGVVGGITSGLSAIPGAMASRTKLEAVRSEDQYDKFIMDFQAELEAWGVRQQAKAAKAALELQLAESQESLREAQETGELTAKIVTGLVAVGVVGTGVYIVSRYWKART